MARILTRSVPISPQMPGTLVSTAPMGGAMRRSHMLHKAVVFTASLALGLAGLGIAGTPSGAEGSGSHCTFQHVPNLASGLSYKPTPGMFTDPGGGYANCVGAVQVFGSFYVSGHV